MRRTELTKRQATNKGLAALGAASGTVLLMFFVSFYFAILGIPITAWLTYNWFKFRAKWGIRF